MGDSVSYVETIVSADLGRMPDLASTALAVLLGEQQKQPLLPEHPLFAKPGWRTMFTGSSAFFPAPAFAKLRPNDGGWRLAARGNGRCEHGEPELFFDFIAPYVDGDSAERIHLGQWQGEDDVDPTLVYLVDGKVRPFRVTPDWNPRKDSKPMRRAPTRHYCPEVRRNDEIQAKLTKAAYDNVLAVLRDLVADKPKAMIRELQPHQVERIAARAVDGYIVERERHLELASLLDDPPPPDWFA